MPQKIRQEVGGGDLLSSARHIKGTCKNAVTSLLACVLCDKKATLLVKAINEDNRKNRNDVNPGSLAQVNYMENAVVGWLGRLCAW